MIKAATITPQEIDFANKLHYWQRFGEWPGEPAPVATTPRFWVCDCDFRRIRPKSEDSCPKCGAQRDESPSARVDEVAKAFGEGEL